MDNILKKEYIHLGTDNIKEELWLDRSIDLFHEYNIKPTGGLWCSELRYGLGDWIEYLRDTSPYNFDYVVAHKKCSLVKFKENSKLARIKDKSDYEHLIKCGYVKKLDEPYSFKMNHYDISIQNIIDYDKLLKDIDLLYVNPNVSNELLLYRITTLLCLNPHSIEYFKPISVDYNYGTIDKVFDKKYVTKPNEDYYNFLKYIREIFNDLSKDCTLDDLYNLQNKLIELLSIDPKIKNFKLHNDINYDLLIENNVRNLIEEKRKVLKK